MCWSQYPYTSQLLCVCHPGPALSWPSPSCVSQAVIPGKPAFFHSAARTLHDGRKLVSQMQLCVLCLCGLQSTWWCSELPEQPNPLLPEGPQVPSSEDPRAGAWGCCPEDTLSAVISIVFNRPNTVFVIFKIQNVVTLMVMVGNLNTSQPQICLHLPQQNSAPLRHSLFTPHPTHSPRYHIFPH